MGRPTPAYFTPFSPVTVVSKTCDTGLIILSGLPYKATGESFLQNVLSKKCQDTFSSAFENPLIAMRAALAANGKSIEWLGGPIDSVHWTSCSPKALYVNSST